MRLSGIASRHTTPVDYVANQLCLIRRKTAAVIVVVFAATEEFCSLTGNTTDEGCKATAQDPRSGSP